MRISDWSFRRVLFKAFVHADLTDEDFVICEIGGTVGDIEGLPFLEAIRQLGNELGRERSLFLHVTLLPYIAAAGELKTTRSEEHTSELQSLMRISYAVFCLKKKIAALNHNVG